MNLSEYAGRGPIQKIAIFRALQLGDMLNTIPAVRALRTAYPEAEIVLLGLPWAASFVKRFDRYFDCRIHFPGYPGLPEQEYDPVAYSAFLHEMRAEEFDLLLQMQGNGTIVNEMLTEFDARLLAGFHNAESRMDPELFLEYPSDEHEIRRHLMLMDHLGIPLAGEEMEFPITKTDERDFRALKLPIEREKYVIIHPGSRGGWRQWPPSYFALLGDMCVSKGFEVVVTGTENERDITREVLKCLHQRAVDATGLTHLGSMGVLLRGASMLISNCTGVSHIAAALHTPSVVISMDGEPYRWGPLDHHLHRTIDWTANQRFDRVVSEMEDLLCSVVGAGSERHGEGYWPFKQSKSAF